jgi:phage-related tail protein
MGRYAEAVARIDEISDHRAAAESTATAAWREWRAEATKLATLTEAVGAAASEVQRQVTEAESALRRTKEEIGTEAAAERKLNYEAGIAQERATAAASRVDERRTELAGVVTAV